MKIIFTTQPYTNYRENIFINTLKKFGHEILINSDFNANISGDIWFIDFYLGSGDLSVYKTHFSKLEPHILNFKGKVLFYSLDDSGFCCSSVLSDSILHKLDGWMTSVQHDKGHVYSSENIYEKMFLIPRFSIPKNNYYDISKKESIFFYGCPTGGNNYRDSKYHKNIRISVVNKMKNGKYKDIFVGGITLYPGYNEPILNDPAFENYKNLIVNRISDVEFLEVCQKNLISLCLNGNGAGGLSYRHLESMSKKCIIISYKIQDSTNWLFKDKVENLFYQHDNDLMNLDSIIEFILTNRHISDKYAEECYIVYKKYFELEDDMSYNTITINHIKSEFQRLNIQI